MIDRMLANFPQASGMLAGTRRYRIEAATGAIGLTDPIRSGGGTEAGQTRPLRGAISRVQPTGPAGDGLARARGELSAVLDETRAAANRIIDAAEAIGERIARLRAALPAHGGEADEVARELTAIYEASHFQDLTGQRVTHVLAVLDRLEGIYRQREPAPAASEDPANDTQGTRLYGPKIPGEDGHATQGDIDRLFG